MKTHRTKTVEIQIVQLASATRCVLCAVLLVLGSQSLLHGDDSRKLPTAKEPDARLQAEGKGWRLDTAKLSDRTRPRVLLIGDSILNGYGNQVIAALDGKAYVDLWVNPHCQSEHLNKLLAEVLANGPYDVVHFNMGLHGWQKGRIKDGTFEPLTKAYVQVIRDKLPNAKIIWASSTAVLVDLAQHAQVVTESDQRTAFIEIREGRVP